MCQGQPELSWKAEDAQSAWMLPPPRLGAVKAQSKLEAIRIPTALIPSQVGSTFFGFEGSSCNPGTGAERISLLLPLPAAPTHPKHSVPMRPQPGSGDSPSTLPRKDVQLRFTSLHRSRSGERTTKEAGSGPSGIPHLLLR